MSELDIMPEEPVVDIADQGAAPSEDQAAPEPEKAETPDGDEEQSETPNEGQGTDEGEQPPEPTRAEKRKAQIKAEIDQLTREKYEAKREAEQIRAEHEQMRQQMAMNQPPPEMQNMPKLADFDYDENAYQNAVQQWHAGNIQHMQQQQQQHAQQQEAYAAQVREQQLLAAKFAEGQQLYPDFSATVSDPTLPALIDVNSAAFEALMESPEMPRVSYFLAKNRKEIYQFHGLTANQAIRRIADLEHRLKHTKPAVQQIPPEPPTKVKGKSTAKVDPSKMDIDTWMKWRKNQLQSKR